MAGEKTQDDPFAGFNTHTDNAKLAETPDPEGGDDQTADEGGDEGDNTENQEEMDLGEEEESLDDGERVALADAEEEADDEADDPDDDPDDTAGTLEDDPEADPEAEELGDDDDPAPKKKRSVKSRIAEFRKRTGSAERRADTAETRLAQAEREIEDLKSGLTPKGKGDSSENEDETYGLEKPSPDDFKYGELDSAYQEELSDYKVDLKFAKRDAAKETSQQETAAQEAVESLNKAYDTRVVDGITEYPDFEKVVVDAAENNEYPLGETIAVLVLQSEVGHHVLYKIAGDLALAKKLDKMTPAQQGREFGRLEAQFAKRTPPKKKNKTQTPPPASRRRGTKTGSGRVKGNTDDFAAFEAQMEADQSRRNKR